VAEEEEGEDEDVINLSGVDVWSKEFNPATVFDAVSIKEITDFFVKYAGDIDGQLR
jgi:hypothetical protein